MQVQSAKQYYKIFFSTKLSLIYVFNIKIYDK